MAALPRNSPRRFYDIVIQVAIIRPGPIVGKMMNPFLKRRQGLEPVRYAHPSLEPVLERTLGVPLFQEQLLRMAMVVANFSGGEAEELRRAMGSKRSQAKMAAIEARLRSGMTENGIAREAQDEIVQSIVSFALYGFPESHAASFALLAYASGYLKCHYLGAFTAALLNNQPMGFYHPATIVKDAQRHGLKVRAIDVTRSQWPCTLECECGEAAPHNRAECRLALRMGLRYVRGLREEAAQALVQERERMPFKSIDDLARRVPELRRNELTMLAQIGALNQLGGEFSDAPLVKAPRMGAGLVGAPCFSRGELDFIGVPGKPRGSACRGESPAEENSVSEGALALGSSSASAEAQDENQFPFRSAKALLPPTEVGGSHPTKSHRRDALWQAGRAAWEEGPLLRELDQSDSASPLAQMTAEERLIADYHGTGLTVGPHPMSYRREEMDRMHVMRAIDLRRLKHGQFTRIAGCVIARQRPGTANGFIFLSLEDETGISNAIITPDLYDQNRLLVIHERFLLIEGILQNVENVISIKAMKVSKLEITEAATRSHDFH
jgi:DNA polymerase III alpha subunit